MRRRTFGSINGRELTLQFSVPSSMEDWISMRPQFRWRRMLNPMNWWRARWNGCRFWIHRRWGLNHRCYCPVGWILDGSIGLFGFGVTFWYSHYMGPSYCWCDKAIEELERR